MRSLIRLALAACLLPQVAPNAHAPSAVAPGQPPASRLASSKLARSLSEAGRRLQLRRLERTRGGEAQAEGGAEAEQQDSGVDAAWVESHAEVDRTRRGFYPRVYEAIADADSNGCHARGVLRVRVRVGVGRARKSLSPTPTRTRTRTRTLTRYGREECSAFCVQQVPGTAWSGLGLGLGLA